MPVVLLSTRALSGESIPPGRTIMLTSLSSIISSFCALRLCRATPTTFILSLCAVAFAVRGLLAWEALGESTYDQLICDQKSSVVARFSFPQHIHFSVRLWRTAFWLATMLGFFIFILFHLSINGLPPNWWALQIVGATMSAAQWLLICYMVFAFFQVAKASYTTANAILLSLHSFLPPQQCFSSFICLARDISLRFRLLSPSFFSLQIQSTFQNSDTLADTPSSSGYSRFASSLRLHSCIFHRVRHYQ
jgi:hypothetical protein